MDKCLVMEAQKKCQCDWCKQNRVLMEFMLKYQYQSMFNKILFDSLNKGEKLI